MLPFYYLIIRFKTKFMSVLKKKQNANVVNNLTFKIKKKTKQRLIFLFLKKI